MLVPFVLVQLAAAMLFFVTARFRLPAVPVLGLFAAQAVLWLVEAFRAAKRRTVAIAAGAGLGALVVFNLPGLYAADREAVRRELAAEEHHYRGTVLFDVHRRYADAVAELDRALAIDPTRAASHSNRGQALLAMGRYADAFAAMHEVVRLAEASPGARFLVGPALDDMLRCLEADPALRATHVGRGLGCYAAGDLDCAVDALAAGGAEPLEGLARLARGERRLRAGADDALADLDLAAERRPHDAGAQLLRALALRRAGRDADARAALAAFRRLDAPRGETARALAARPDDPLHQELLALSRIW
jgi:tetratricopeptide (TPR) repeat protein